MREIKFRAWLPNKKEMDYACEVGNGFLNDIFKHHSNRVYMQFTALLDKTGREIYEGDIITHNHDGMIGAVCWSEGLYRFLIEKDDEIIADLCDYDFEPEVIGNIYENPELLK